MSSFLLPVPSHTIGNDLITVQYDRAMIPILTGLLSTSGSHWNFDPVTGDPIDGESYVSTLIDQLTHEVSAMALNPTFLEPYAFTIGNSNLLQPANSPSSPATYNDLYSQQTDPSVGWIMSIDMYLPIGDVDIVIRGATSTAAGIYRVGITGESYQNTDYYAASPNWHDVRTITINNSTAGVKTVYLQTDGKNALSSLYRILLYSITIKAG